MLNDLLIKDCTADIILNIIVLTYDNIERSLSLLLDSSDDWSGLTYSDDLNKTVGYYAGIILRDVTTDPNVKGYRIERYRIMKGEIVDHMKTHPFIRNGKRFRRAYVDNRYNVTFLPEDEI